MPEPQASLQVHSRKAKMIALSTHVHNVPRQNTLQAVACMQVADEYGTADDHVVSWAMRWHCFPFTCVTGCHHLFATQLAQISKFL